MKTWGVLRSPSAEKIWKVALPTGDYEDHTINYLPKSLGIASTTRLKLFTFVAEEFRVGLIGFAIYVPIVHITKTGGL